MYILFCFQFHSNATHIYLSSSHYLRWMSANFCIFSENIPWFHNQSIVSPWTFLCHSSQAIPLLWIGIWSNSEQTPWFLLLFYDGGQPIPCWYVSHRPTYAQPRNLLFRHTYNRLKLCYPHASWSTPAYSSHSLSANLCRHRIWSNNRSEVLVSAKKYIFHTPSCSHRLWLCATCSSQTSSTPMESPCTRSTKDRSCRIGEAIAQCTKSSTFF